MSHRRDPDPVEMVSMFGRSAAVQRPVVEHARIRQHGGLLQEVPEVVHARALRAGNPPARRRATGPGAPARRATALRRPGVRFSGARLPQADDLRTVAGRGRETEQRPKLPDVDVPAVAERVSPVRWPLREAHAQEQQGLVPGVRHRVERLRKHGGAPGGDSGRALERSQRGVPQEGGQDGGPGLGHAIPRCDVGEWAVSGGSRATPMPRKPYRPVECRLRDSAERLRNTAPQQLERGVHGAGA